MVRLGIVAVVVLVSIFRLAGYFTEPRLSDAEIHAVAGEPARLMHTPAGPESVRIATWNIERGVQFTNIATALRAIDADIVLLQEVDRYCKRSGNRDIARELGEVLGMNWVSGGEFQEVGEANGRPAAITGQAILSKYPIADPGVIVFADQSSARWRFNPMQPRRGGRMALRARTAGLTLYSVHLESGGDDEQRARQLAEVVADQSRQSAQSVVIGGDFNNHVAFQSFLFDGLRSAGFADALGALSPRETSMNHRHPIDWLFVRGGLSARGRVERVANASDHYPLVADVVR